MAQKRGNNVKPPVPHSQESDGMVKHTIKESLVDQHHGEDTTPIQNERNIGQHMENGRPPLMKK